MVFKKKQKREINTRSTVTIIFRSDGLKKQAHIKKNKINTLYLKQDHPGALDLRSNGLVLEFHSCAIDRNHRIQRGETQ